MSVFLVSCLFAQSLELFYNGERINPMDEITISDHPDSEMMVINTLDVKNISETTIEILCVREIIENIDGSENTFCWGGLCYPINIDNSSNAATLSPQSLTNEFSGDYDPRGYAGTTKVEYTFYAKDKPDDNVAVIVNYDASDPNTIQESNLQDKLSKAYPNPANNIVSVDYNLSDISNARIAFYNLLGSKVNEIALTEPFGTLTINTTDFVEGIYFYSLLINNEATKTQKLIIKH